MKCRDLRPHLSALADGNLEAKWRSEVERHLGACDGCAAFYRQQVALNRLFQKEELLVEPPQHLWQGIQARLRHPSQPTWRERWVGHLPALQPLQLRYAAAALFVVLVLGVFLFFPSGERDVESAKLLAELEAYSLEVRGNPFLVERRPDQNPFFTFEQPLMENPFGGSGSGP